MSNTKQPKRQVLAIVMLEPSTKSWIDDLVSETIKGGLVEDFNFKNKKEAKAALSYLKQKIRDIDINDFNYQESDYE